MADVRVAPAAEAFTLSTYPISPKTEQNSAMSRGLMLTDSLNTTRGCPLGDVSGLERGGGSCGVLLPASPVGSASG